MDGQTKQLVSAAGPRMGPKLFFRWFGLRVNNLLDAGRCKMESAWRGGEGRSSCSASKTRPDSWALPAMVSYFIRKEKGEKEPRGGVVRERERVEEILELRIV